MPIGEINSAQTYCFGKRTDKATFLKSFIHRIVLLSDILQKQYQEIMHKKLKKNRASDILQFLSHFWENEYAAQLTFRRLTFISNQILNIPSFENKGFSYKP